MLDPLSNLFLSCFNQLGLSQWVKFPTFIPSGNTLDLILTSELDRVGDVFSLPLLPGCHHVPVICDYLFMFTDVSLSPHAPVKRDWTRGKYTIINSHILDIDWDFEFDGLDLDGQLLRFMSILDSLISLYVPLVL